LLVTGFILLRRSAAGGLRTHLPIVAFGMLGWLMLSDSLISRYFLYGLVLLILSRYAFKKWFYLLSVLWLTFVTVVTAWSHLGLDMLGYHATSNALNPVNSPLTRAILTLFLNDRFISAATVANILVFLSVGFYAIR